MPAGAKARKKRGLGEEGRKDETTEFCFLCPPNARNRLCENGCGLIITYYSSVTDEATSFVTTTSAAALAFNRRCPGTCHRQAP